MTSVHFEVWFRDKQTGHTEEYWSFQPEATQREVFGLMNSRNQEYADHGLSDKREFFVKRVVTRREETVVEPCEFTHAHTRDFCGNILCREG